MTWSKLSDDFGLDTWSLSDAAFRLHVEGLLWSNRNLLDGELMNDDLERLKARAAVSELIDKGFWSAQRAGGYRILHHMGYQPTSEQVIARQAANRANGSKGGKAKARGRAILSPQDQQRARFSDSLSNSASISLSDSLSERQKNSDSLSEPSSERDGSGYKEKVSNSKNRDFSGWPVAPIPGSSREPGICSFVDANGVVCDRQVTPGSDVCSEHWLAA